MVSYGVNVRLKYWQIVVQLCYKHLLYVIGFNVSKSIKKNLSNINIL